jgi:mono/diheme cytochrome c family protein
MLRKNITTRIAQLSATTILFAAVATVGVRTWSMPQEAHAPQTQPALIRSTKGEDLFRAYCASCHGKDAKGHGPAAAAMKAKVPDLTVLAQNNHGEFPESRVRRTISGDDVILSHGSREMPIWGPVFHQIEEDIDRGIIRMDNLVTYLKSIQSPE